MNYAYTDTGLYHSNNGRWGRIDYSRYSTETIPNLDEGNLNERLGINAQTAETREFGIKYSCKEDGGLQRVEQGSSSVDWDCNGNKDEVAVANIYINGKDLLNNERHNPHREVHVSYNDWPELKLEVGCYAEFPESSIETCPIRSGGLMQMVSYIEPIFPFDPSIIDESDLNDPDLLKTPYSVLVNGGGIVQSISPEVTFTSMLTITNIGEEQANMIVEITENNLGLFNTSSVPSEIFLQPDEKVMYDIRVTIPSDNYEGLGDQLKIQVYPQQSPQFVSNAIYEIWKIEKQEKPIYLPFIVR